MTGAGYRVAVSSLELNGGSGVMQPRASLLRAEAS
jgi:hypothetical protein